jgi:single-strand DNA-binding protein
MSDINSVVVVGRVVEKPVIKYGASGTAVSTIRIANNVYMGAGKDEKVNWLKVTVFGKTAENCEKYLDKGNQIIVEGRLDWSSWENKDGQKRSEVKIVANRVQFIGKKNDQSQQPVQNQSNQNQPAAEPAPASEAPPVDNQETMDMPTPDTNNDFNSQFDSPIDDTDDIPF